jgi:ABC-type nitrate/sulfonate/bicarbonate transport system substrate-binding protein
MAAMLGGSMDIAQLGGEAVVNAQTKGANVVIVGSMSNQIILQLASTPNLSKPSDLKGKTVAVTQGGTSAKLALVTALKANGMTEQDVNITYLGDDNATVAALAAHQVDAIVTTRNFVNRAEKQGDKMLIDIAAMNIPFLNGPIAVTRDYLKNHRPETVNFLKGQLEAAHRVKTDKAFSEQVIKKYYKIEDPGILDNAYDEARQFIVPDLHASADAVQAVLDLDDIKGHKPEEFIDTSLIDELNANGFIKSLG